MEMYQSIDKALMRALSERMMIVELSLKSKSNSQKSSTPEQSMQRLLFALSSKQSEIQNLIDGRKNNIDDQSDTDQVDNVISFSPRR